MADKNNWHSGAADWIAARLTENACNLMIERFAFKGSFTEPALLDRFSDIDVEVYFKDGYAADTVNRLLTLFEQKCLVFAKELHEYEGGCTLRLCLDNGWRFDLSLLYPHPASAPVKTVCWVSEFDKIIDTFWFAVVMALVKTGRGDYLIASHLALETARLTIVFQMLLRDEEKETNIHRFGDKETVYALRDMPGVFPPVADKNSDYEAAVIMHILDAETQTMERLAAKHKPGYRRRYEAFMRIREMLEFDSFARRLI